jgi:hypothetical protein
MAETGSYIPPQSPIAIQPGDKGFEIVGKGYNRWLWTFPDWKKGKKKIIDPNANWGLNAKPMSQKEIDKKMKGLYLTEGSHEKIEGGLSSGRNLREIAILHTYDDSKDHVDREEIEKMLAHLKNQMYLGIEVEMEHTEDPSIAAEIAKDHLTEDPDYYTKLKKIEESMKHVVNYDSFVNIVNESKIFEGDVGDVTDSKTPPVEIAPTKTKISVVKTQKQGVNDPKTKKPQYKVLKGAIRLSYPGKKQIDYKIESQSALYDGPIVPSNFFKSTKGDYYIMMTNAGQTQRIETEDINQVIKGYKEGKTWMKVPVYKDVIGIPAKVADLIFKKTSDFSDLK